MQDLAPIRRNIAKAISHAKKRGTTGMSLANLKQITQTVGVNVTVSEYHRVFDSLAAEVATSLQFNLV